MSQPTCDIDEMPYPTLPIPDWAILPGPFVEGKLNKLHGWHLHTLSAPFYTCHTIQQLATAQGITTPTDLAPLAGLISDEEMDEFVATIYWSRRVSA